MGRLLAIAALVIGFAAPAAEIPNYLNPVQGKLLSGLFTRDSFTFSPGQPQNCAQTTASGLTLYKCESVTGASITIPGRENQTIALNRVLVFFKTNKQYMDIIQEYTYVGTWTENGISTPVELTLWNLRMQPSVIHGYLKLPEHNVFASIAATQN